MGSGPWSIPRRLWTGPEGCRVWSSPAAGNSVTLWLLLLEVHSTTGRGRKWGRIHAWEGQLPGAAGELGGGVSWPGAQLQGGGQKVRAPGRPVFSGRCGPGPPGVAGAHRVGAAHSLGPVPPGGIANGHHVLNTEAQLYSTQSGPGMLSPGPGAQGMPSPTRGGGRPGCEAGTSELRPLRPALGSHCC